MPSGRTLRFVRSSSHGRATRHRDRGSITGMDPVWPLLVLAALLVAVGIAGTVLPALPGALLVLIGLGIAAWAEGFAFVGTGSLVAIAILAVLTYGVDFAATALGAKKLGASRRALVGAVVGGLVGLFFGLPGVLLGPFLGAVIGEYSAHGNLERAGKAGLGTWLGMVFGAAVKLALIFSMIGIFVVARFL